MQSAVGDQEHERGDVRIDRAAERHEPVVGHRPRDCGDQAEDDGHRSLPYSCGDRSRRRRARTLPRAQRAGRRGHRRGRLDRQRPARLPLARRALGAARPDGRRSRGHALARSRARLAVLGGAARRRRASARTPRTPRSPASSSAGLIAGVVTQNIDGLHHAAGSEAVEVHGHLRTARCLPAARGGDGARARALRREEARAGVPRLRRDAATAGRALRRAAAADRRGAPPWRSSRRRAAASASAPRCRSTRPRAWPRRSPARAGRSRSSRWSRRRSGRTPISRLLRSAEELLPAVASILLD